MRGRALMLLGASILALAGCGNGAHSHADPHPRYVDCGAHSLNVESLVGISTRAASEKAGKAGCVIRPVIIDGQRVAITAEGVSYRVDVSVNNGVVVRILGRG